MNVDKENHKFHCALINSISVGNKAPHIIDLITENKLDFLIITETWLCDGDIVKVSLIHRMVIQLLLSLEMAVKEEGLLLFAVINLDVLCQRM